MGFQEQVTSALASLGGDGLATPVDAIADPTGALAALQGEALAAVTLRVAPELGAAPAAYGPDPAEPLWARLTKGSSVVTTVPLRGGEKANRTAIRVEVDTRTARCCDSPTCSLDRRFTAAWLVVDGKASRLLVTEKATPVDAPAPLVVAIARLLATLLGVPLETGTALVTDEVASAAKAEAQPSTGTLTLTELARYALRSEGDRFVLRDWANRGPRATARRNAIIGFTFLAVALVVWSQLTRVRGAEGAGLAVALGAAGALLTLTGTAFLGVARFSSRYSAVSAPLVSLGRDRLVVLPWVSRTGAVDERPEGRLGAGIPLVEVHRASTQKRGTIVAVELDTDHGPIDALSVEREELAGFWAVALARVADDVRHPQAGASARQRARARR